MKTNFVAQLTSLVLFTLIACGQPKVKQFAPGEKVKSPEYPQTTAINLAADTAVHTYVGGFLLFDKQITPAQVQQLLAASHSYNEALTDVVKYNTEVLIPAAEKVTALTAERETLLRQKEKAVAEKNKDAVRQLRVNAETWFDTELNKLEVSDETKIQAKKVYAKYCEAKVWEFAVKKAVQVKYKSLPTPTALCDGFYKANAVFDSEECKATDENGRSFFKCFWEAAVMKTSFTIKGRQNPDGSVADALFLESQRPQLLALANSASFAEDLSIDMDNKVLMATNHARPRPGVSNPRYKAEYDIFKVTLKNKTLDSTTAFTILGAVDERASHFTAYRPNMDQWRLVSPATNTEANVKAGEVLADKLASFSAPRFVEKTVSANEVIFNNTLTIPAVGVPEDFTRDGLPEIFPVMDDSIPELDQKIAVELQSLNDARAHYNTVKVPMLQPIGDDFCAAQTGNLACVLKAGQDAKVSAVGSPGAISTLSSSFTVTTQTVDGVMKVTLKLDKNAPRSNFIGFGCVKLETGEAMACEQEDNRYVAMNVSLDPVSKKLTLEVQLQDKSNVERWGLAKKAPVYNDNGTLADPSFNKLEASELADKTLVVELLPSSLKGMVPFFSGDIYVRSGKTNVFQGSASYLFDQSVRAEPVSE